MCLTLTICNGHDHIRVRSDYDKEKDVVNAHDHRMEVTKKIVMLKLDLVYTTDHIW